MKNGYRTDGVFGYNHWIPMQYTGFKDKNDISAEVYEHDVLHDGKGSYYKVEWDYRDTGWVGININDYDKKSLVKLLIEHSMEIW